MNEPIKIQGNKIKVLEGYQDNDQMGVLMVLLIIHYSITGNALSVPLKKLAFILDVIKKQVPAAKLAVLLSSPWEISADLRKKIILAHEKQFLVIKDSKSTFGFSLSEKGTALVEQIEKLDLIPVIRQEIRRWCKEITVKELKNQHLIW